MKTIFKIIKQEKYDRYVFVHYNEHKQICGLNFHQGLSDGPLKEWYESDERIMREYKSLCEELTCETTETYRINTALERYWKMTRLEEDGPQISMETKATLNNLLNKQCEKYCVEQTLNKQEHAEFRAISNQLINFLIRKII